MANYNEPQNQSIIERINLSKRDLEKIIEHRTKGAVLRSKSQWYNEGERNTKYFVNLEKRHFKQGTISQLKINDGNEHVQVQGKVTFYTNVGRVALIF